MNKSSHLQRGGPLSGFLRGREKGKGRVGWGWDENGPLTPEVGFEGCWEFTIEILLDAFSDRELPLPSPD